jgi:hypothetical protein
MSTTTSSNIGETDKKQEKPNELNKSVKSYNEKKNLINDQQHKLIEQEQKQEKKLPFPLKKPNKSIKQNELNESKNIQQYSIVESENYNKSSNQQSENSINKEQIIDNLANMFTEIFERLSALEEKQKK